MTSRRRAATSRGAANAARGRTAAGRRTAPARGRAAAGGKRSTTAGRGRTGTARSATRTTRGGSRTTSGRGAPGMRRAGAAPARRTARATAPTTTSGFGSIFRMTARPGMKDELRKTMTSRNEVIPGMVAVHLFDTGGSEAWGVAIFRNEKAYRDNASSPDQNRRYQDFRRLLEADPEWHDGSVMSFQAR